MIMVRSLDQVVVKVGQNRYQHHRNRRQKQREKTIEKR